MKALSTKAIEKSPPRWRKRYIFAVFAVAVLSLIWSGYVEIEVSVRFPVLKPGQESSTTTNETESQNDTLPIKKEIDSVEKIHIWWNSERGEEFVWTTLWYVVFMLVVHVVFRFLWKNVFIDRKHYYSFNLCDRFYLAEKIPSSIHGAVCGVVAIYILFFTDTFTNDVIDSHHPLCDWMLAFSFGYEIYDLIIMFLQKDFSIIMWIHHFSLCVSYFLVMTQVKLEFVAMAMLITELTVLPSNLHWYLKMFRMRATRLYHFNQGLRLWSFVLLRLTTPPYVWYHLYRHLDIFIAQPPLVRYSAYILTSLLAMMNVYWTRTMFMLYQKRVTLNQKRAMAQISQIVKNNIEVDQNSPVLTRSADSFGKKNE